MPTLSRSYSILGSDSPQPSETLKPVKEGCRRCADTACPQSQPSSLREGGRTAAVLKMLKGRGPSSGLVRV